MQDLDRLFGDLRDVRPGKGSVREIGHFAAHRRERDKGISLTRADDIRTSMQLWHKQREGNKPTITNMKVAAKANFAIMPEERIRDRFSISRQTAMQSFSKGIAKYAARRHLKPREAEILKVFGLSMMWQYALSDETLFADFKTVLIKEGSLCVDDAAAFDDVSRFVSLYALSILHGSRLRLSNGSTAPLRLTASDETDKLRINAAIPLEGLRKPCTASVPVFETSLYASDHCDSNQLGEHGEPYPLEIDGDRLVPIG